MNHRRCFVALAFAAASALAQTTPAKPAADINPKSGEKCIIEGKVVRASDGTPLKKAVVTVLLQQPQPGSRTRPLTATADADGKFFLKDLDPGRYTLAAARTGYVRQTYGQRTPTSPPTTLTLLEGQHVKDVVFRLLAGAAISGRVVDEDSEPISGVRIQALRWGNRNGRRELLPGGTWAVTDDRGEYRMFQLSPGRYYVSASYTGTGYMEGGVTISYGKGDASDEAYAATYYPGVNDPAQAGAVEVRPGDDLSGINLRLLPSRTVRISGRVLKSGAEPPGGEVFVRITPRHASGVVSFNRGALTDDHGFFEIKGVPLGSYALLAEFDDGKRLQARAEVDVDNSDVEGVVLALRPPLEVQGHVRLEGTIDLQAAQIRVVLMPQQQFMFFGGASAVLDSDLNFALTELSDGDYTLRFFGLPPDAYVSSATMGRRDVLFDGVSLRGKAEALQIVISASGGRLDGAVMDEHDQPFTGARVVLVPDESRWKRQDLFKIASSDQYGQFSIRGITPGKYKVFAWETVDEGAYYDPEFLRPILDRGRSVEISPAGRADAQVKVIRPETSGG